ncbi:MAG TPA: AgmX/PglI C-terminal domain-containing protein [Nannocystis exedens]|nr:AgmX/PglI C-terminal domain-containing protein [Nannocystis exedens]
MTTAKSFILPAVAALVLIGYYLWQSTNDEPRATAPREEKKQASGNQNSNRSTASRVEPEPTRTPQVAPSGPPKVRSQATRKLERVEREALRQRIQEAQRTRLRRPSNDPIEPEALGPLSPEYIKDRISEDLMPLAVECYELALDESPDLQGGLALHFRIEGEPDVGGLVVDAKLTDDSEIQHPGLVECMRESMMSVSFDPPEDGGAIEVTYPFAFGR